MLAPGLQPRRIVDLMLLRLAAAALAIALVSPSLRAFQNPTSTMLVSPGVALHRHLRREVFQRRRRREVHPGLEDLVRHTASSSRVAGRLSPRAGLEHGHLAGLQRRVRGERRGTTRPRGTHDKAPAPAVGRSGQADGGHRHRKRALQHQQHPAHGEPPAVRLHLSPAGLPETILGTRSTRGTGTSEKTSGCRGAKETAKPTLIRGTSDKDLPASGKSGLRDRRARSSAPSSNSKTASRARRSCHLPQRRQVR